MVEGLPVHESIKLGEKDRDRYIGIYIENLRILARHGIRVVCYNFMPVFGWLRTDLHRRLADGSATLAFDPQVLREMDPEKEELRLPGWTHSTGKEEIGRLLSAYQSLGKEGLRKNLQYFLEAVTGEAERLGLKLAIHPDDPPLPVFGLPRVVSTREDLLAIAKMTKSRACGFTLCTGSLGSSPGNDVVRIARELASMGGSTLYMPGTYSGRRTEALRSPATGPDPEASIWRRFSGRFMRKALTGISGPTMAV